MGGRRWLGGLIVLGAAILVACGGGDDDDAAVVEAATLPPTATATPEPARTPPARDLLSEAEAQVARGLKRDLPALVTEKRTVALTEIINLLPPDAIPSIDNPQYDTVEAASAWLQAQEPVISFEVNGDVRAYPLQILTWHEIVNDVVGGEPVMVTYCPLCNSAIAFSRIVDGEERTFGTSGKLRRSDLIMYDREKQSLWQQFSGEAIVGTDAGTVLEFLPAQIVSFEEFAAAFPDGLVLNQDTGHSRDYGRNPYSYYDRSTSTIVPVDEFEDARLDAKERVLTIELGGEPVAFPFSALSERIVIEAEVGGEPIVAFWQPGQVSALDEVFIVGSRNVGSAAAFRPFLDGDRLTFEGRDGAIVDVGTGSTWDIFGRAIDGPLAGAQLETVISGSHFWFAWSVFQPETRVIFGTEAGDS